MISFEELSLVDGVPIYTQLILYLKRGMASGAIVDGDELPSRRTISALLGVNPNTVQKACRQLEEEGFLQSRAGAKSYAALTENQVTQLRRELLQEDVRALISAMKQSGVSREDALSMLGQLWEDEP